MGPSGAPADARHHLTRTPTDEAEASPATVEWRRLREVLGIVTVFRVVSLGIALGATWLMSTGTDSPGFGLGIWRQWDAEHLLGIAEIGYNDPRSNANWTAFWPGFPLVVRAMRFVGFGSTPAGMLISALGTLSAAYYLHRLAEHDGHSGRRAVLGMLLFPTAVFLVAPYTEGLFLGLTIPAFYYARKGHPRPVYPLVFAATLVRSNGTLVALGCAVELLVRTHGVAARCRRFVLTCAAGAAAVACYGLYLQRTRGDFFEFQAALRRGWNRSLTAPWDSFLATAGRWSGEPVQFLRFASLLEIAAAILSLALTIWLIRSREWGYVAFVGGSTALTLCGTIYFSLPRYLLAYFPMHLLLSDAMRERDRESILIGALAAMFSMGVVVYTAGDWYF